MDLGIRSTIVAAGASVAVSTAVKYLPGALLADTNVFDAIIEVAKTAGIIFAGYYALQAAMHSARTEAKTGDVNVKVGEVRKDTEKTAMATEANVAIAARTEEKAEAGRAIVEAVATNLGVPVPEHLSTTAMPKPRDPLSRSRSSDKPKPD